MQRKNVAAVYCRTASLLEDGHQSLLEQSSECIQKALNDGYRKIECVVDVRSGHIKKRLVNRELKSLRKLIRSQKVDVLYVASLSRLSRDWAVVTQLRSYCKRHKVRIVACDLL